MVNDDTFLSCLHLLNNFMNYYIDNSTIMYEFYKATAYSTNALPVARPQFGS